MFGLTLLGWVVALSVAWFLRKTVVRGASTPFVMELPPYRLPTWRGIVIHTWERTWQYAKKAGTFILAVSILLWAAMTFPGLPKDRAEALDAQTRAAATLNSSAAGRLGSVFEPVSKLAGFDWRANIALIGGIAAKEVILSTMGTAYSLSRVDREHSAPLSERLASSPDWSVPAGIAFMVFILFYSPCFPTLVAIGKETSWRWSAFSVAFNTALAFGLAVAVYQLGTCLFL
jgi:ferrous iron transport protein B